MNEPEGRKEICKECTWRRELERRSQAIARRMAERVDIPERLDNDRKRLGLTQEQHAKRLGIPLGTYWTYAQGRRGRRLNEKMYRHIIEQTQIPWMNPQRNQLLDRKQPAREKAELLLRRPFHARNAKKKFSISSSVFAKEKDTHRRTGRLRAD